MNRKRTILILVFIGLIAGLGYLLNVPYSPNEPAKPIAVPTETAPPLESIAPSPTPISEPTPIENAEPEANAVSSPKKIIKAESTPVPKKQKTDAKPLMEIVDEDSNIGEETADGEETPVQKEPEAAAAPNLNPTDTVEDLMKDANLIIHGFEEADTDEISGVWSGTVVVGRNKQSAIILNRIWDHMTDDYLATSCFGFKNKDKLVTGYLRHKTLHFYEKPGSKRTKLIVKLQKKFLFEILAPSAGSNKTTGQAYEIQKNRLIPIGTVSIRKDSEATADTDCVYIE